MSLGELDLNSSQKLADLFSAQTVFFREGHASHNDVEWGNWSSGVIHLERRTKDVPENLKKAHSGKWGGAEKGDIRALVLAHKNGPTFSQQDYVGVYDGHGVFQVEGHYLQIHGLNE